MCEPDAPSSFFSKSAVTVATLILVSLGNITRVVDLVYSLGVFLNLLILFVRSDAPYFVSS